MDLKEIVRLLSNIISIYKGISDSVELIKLNCSKEIYTPCVLIKNIYTKCSVELIINEIISETKNSNDINAVFSGHMVIYSNNADSIHGKLSQLVKLIADGNSEEELNNLNIKNIVIPNELFYTSKFDSYEIDKKYLVKRFNEAGLSSIPTGLSTAYLNIHGKFTSVGYLTFGDKGDDYMRLKFLSVEEKMDDFFRTNNFDIFKNDENQIL